MLDLTTDGTGVLLPVQAQPKAKKNAIVGVHDGRLKVAVTAAPERGKANDAILKLLAKELRLKRSQLELISGATSSKKTICITEMTLPALRQRLEQFTTS